MEVVSPPHRIPVVLVDRLGYNKYRSRKGRAYLPAEEFDVYLATDVSKVDAAIGDELKAVAAVDARDEAALLGAAEFLCSLAGSAERPRLVTVLEMVMLPVAQLRQRLNLPGDWTPEVSRYRDKLVMKRHLRHHGIRVPEFAEVTEESVERLLRRHSSVFIKPRLGAGSIDVWPIHSRADAARFLAANAERLADYEVEEFIDGELFHVDSVVQDGRVVAATAGRTIDPTVNYRTGKPCRDIDVGPGETLDCLLTFSQSVHACFPWFTGVTHHEMFLANGTPVFCEIAGRPGGGGIIAGFHSRTGADLVEMAVRAQATGSVSPDLSVATHLTGFAMVYSDGPTVVPDIMPIGEPWVVELQGRRQIGKQVPAPRHWGDSIATVTVMGKSEAEVLERLDEAVRRIETQLTHCG